MRMLPGSLVVALAASALAVAPLSAQNPTGRPMQVKKDFSTVIPTIEKVSASPSPIHLSPPGTLSGVVYTEVQMGVGEVACQLESDLGDGSGKMRHQWTKKDGRVAHYNFRYTKAGTYTLTFAGAGGSAACGGSQSVTVTVVP